MIPRFVSVHWIEARATWRRLLLHFTLFADSRTFCTAGSSRPISTAMMAITTSNSIRVNARRRRKKLHMTRTPKELRDLSLVAHLEIVGSWWRILDHFDAQDGFPRIGVFLVDDR